MIYNYLPKINLMKILEKFIKKHISKSKRKKRELEWRKKNPHFNVIRNWKRRGLVSDNYMIIYDKWKNTKNCENCNVELTVGNKGSTKKCLDHSHITGEFRNILCNTCNVRRGETNI